MYSEALIHAFSNALYKEWLKTHDFYQDDFLALLIEIAPNISFAYSTDSKEIIITSAQHNIF
jgi:hypothetical protein